MIRGLITRFTGRQTGRKRHQRKVVAVYRRHVARALAEERWSSADIFLDRILDVAPTSTEAWLMKGFLSQHCRDDADEARACFEQVVDLCRQHPEHPHGARARTSLAALTSEASD